MTKRMPRSQMILDLARTIDPGRHWFAVETAPGCERAAARDLQGADIGLWLPHFRAVTVRRTKRAEVSTLFFPGYFFAGITPSATSEKLDLIRECEHVIRVLRVDGKPFRIPTAILQAAADRLTGNTRSERLSVAAAFRVGEMRQVIQGPFASFMAQITELLATGRVKVDISVFGRMTPVELDPQFLDAA